MFLSLPSLFSRGAKKSLASLGWLSPLVLLAALPALGQQPNCDPTLFAHVYHPNRLHVLKPCTAVTGTIVHVVKEPDGDDHIRLKVDPPFQHLINERNTDGQHGDLVVEPICEHQVTQLDAQASCAGWQHKAIAIPKQGTHVRVVGALVEDDQHAATIDGKRVAWREIHPVTSIEVIPRASGIRWFAVELHKDGSSRPDPVELSLGATTPSGKRDRIAWVAIDDSLKVCFTSNGNPFANGMPNPHEPPVLNSKVFVVPKGEAVFSGPLKGAVQKGDYPFIVMTPAETCPAKPMPGDGDVHIVP